MQCRKALVMIAANSLLNVVAASVVHEKYEMQESLNDECC